MIMIMNITKIMKNLMKLMTFLVNILILIKHSIIKKQKNMKKEDNYRLFNLLIFK